MKKCLPCICFVNVFLILCFSGNFLLISGCGRDSTSRQQYYQSAPKSRPYPAQQVNRAKSMMDQGYELYRQALNSTDQQEKNALIKDALNNYYYPAQEILQPLTEQYPEHASDIDNLHQLLSQRISSAVRTEGTGD